MSEPKRPPEEMPSTGNRLADIALRGILQELELAAERFAELRAEVRELRASSLKYQGTWSGPAATYHRGDAVTRDGGLWVAVAGETNQRPGTGNDWQLAVKSSR